MAVIKAFRALRPTPEACQAVASVPYDVISVPEARTLAAGSPLSFLHVIRPEIDLPAGTDEHDDGVYAQGAANLARYAHSPASLLEDEPALYAYRLCIDGHSQTGLYGLVSVREYDRGAILKHENTRPPKVADRTRHILTQRAHAEPVFLTFRDHDGAQAILDRAQTREPLYDFVADDRVQHTVWKLEDSKAMVSAFATVPALYVADGHHRCEAGSRAWHAERHAGSDHFLAVCFPMSATRILAYNRVVRVTDPRAFVQQVAARCAVVPNSGLDTPKRAGEVGLYADGAWHTVTLPPTQRTTIADTLDVARLEEFILDPILGITDQRTDPNITFVGGIRGADELVRRVDAEPGLAAFSMFATSVGELLDVSDAGLLMPPKSTWFEPKLRSGLLVHRFD